MERWRSQTNLINVVFALLLFLLPWTLGFSGETAAWNAWISGALLAAMSARAVVAFAEWEEWTELALGVWTGFALGAKIPRRVIGQQGARDDRRDRDAARGHRAVEGALASGQRVRRVSDSLHWSHFLRETPASSADQARLSPKKCSREG